MDAEAREDAIAEIQQIFASYRAAMPDDQALLETLRDGKLYELFVLAHLVTDLSNRGFALTFVGSTNPRPLPGALASTLRFKASPGQIKLTDSHFAVRAPSYSKYRMFVDIEFDTLGSDHSGATDRSRRHELDIVVTTASGGYPAHHEIALGVECKALANFGKHVIKEALGVRRELSLLDEEDGSILTREGGRPPVMVSASPASEFWLAFIDPAGTGYSQSPAVFGIELKHIEPA